MVSEGRQLRTRLRAGSFCVAILLAAGGLLQADAGSADRSPADSNPPSVGITGITVPYRIAEMGAVAPGRIERVAVTEGQAVDEGALLVALDDSIQQVRTETAQAQARSMLAVELAKARREQAERDLEWLTGLGPNSSPKELNDARTQAQVAQLEHEVARFEHDQAVRIYQRERLALEDLSIKAPFAGYISELLKEVGETVDEQEGVLTLVQLDPLLVTIDCPLDFALSLRVGDRLPIRPFDPRWGPRVGEVVLANRVADAASQTTKVKLAVENSDGEWMSGMKVVVDFSQVQAGDETRSPSSPEPATARLEPANADTILTQKN
jgi:RND family efflux transporter MFP subunit